MSITELLNQDTKHFRLYEAEKLCNLIPEETYNYITEDEYKRVHFEECSLDSLPDHLEPYEFLWHNYWNEFIKYLKELYNV